MNNTIYDVIVIGAGPGGYVTAIRGAQLGLKCALVEREHLGGICLNWGCIPTKALLRTAEVFHLASRAKDFGLKADGLGYEPGAVIQRSRAISAQLNTGVGFLLKKNKVDVIWGEATITRAPGVTVPGEVAVRATEKPAVLPQHAPPKAVIGPGAYQARHIIVATGARPRVLPGVEPDGDRIWTYFEAMNPPSIPQSLIVVGSGAIGIEFASFYRTLGVDVTVLEVLPQILPAEDAEIAALARKQFEKAGIKVLTDARVVAVAKEPGGVRATVVHNNASQEISAERLLSAVGVVGNTENLGLESLGVELRNGTIATGAFGRTNVDGIYAIGDVAGPPMLAHKAEHEGVACIEAIAGRPAHTISRDRIPGCTYCHPQIASVGLTEARAREAGIDILVGRFPFRGNGKAIALGETEGMVKTIFDAKDGRLIGAHLCGAEVTELIQGFVIAIQCGATQHDLSATIFPHPTLSEMMHESVLAAVSQAIHI
ncbi:dihydrolipoyl dehydrogenase [Hyphomicrobium sp.]|uniref:dihydrolipoyl dehydrogenase n=1 Tax=Hyphomicrobium sp. TaxID=82 RepID=UPI0025B9BFDA|nr:dihydrolipoyl dehydrogenase [Hyphomicrobium sp.]MCC7253684.1 dihydrolipoyl dehydrogenase [Hyphomicrobium sp.]